MFQTTNQLRKPQGNNGETGEIMEKRYLMVLVGDLNTSTMMA
jgi:hypothetical protein